MTTLILVRHGQSEANLQKVFAGYTDAKLLPKGLEQAKVTAEYVTAHYPITAVYASDLDRAYRTGKCAADLLGLEITADPRLREIFAGEWEGQKYDDLVELFPEDYAVWLRDIGAVRCTGGETMPQMAARVTASLTEIAEAHRGETVLVATHATPIRIMQSLVAVGSLAAMQEIPWVSNASFSVLTYDDGKWAFTLVGEDRHLADLKTVLPKNV